jgi:ATP-dependent Clp protease ATP-binding subunit ClpC
MPKINVYLPDDLADTVKEIGLPVSAICQRALEQSAKRVSAIRAVDDLTGEDPTAALTSFTQRARDALKLAITAAGHRGVAELGTRDLLLGMVNEGSNLALYVLRSMEVDPARVLRDLRQLPDEPAEAGVSAARFGATAANALELAVVDALTLGHNYVGCEHLLLGLVAEPDGAAGRVLRELGVEHRQVRHAVSAALAGYVHLMANEGGVAAAMGQAMEPLLRRLDRLEEKAGLA